MGQPSMVWSLKGSRATQWQGVWAELPLGSKSTPLWDLSDANIWRMPGCWSGAGAWEKCQGWREKVPVPREGLSQNNSPDPKGSS